MSERLFFSVDKRTIGRTGTDPRADAERRHEAELAPARVEHRWYDMDDEATRLELLGEVGAATSDDRGRWVLVSTARLRVVEG